MSAHRTDQPGTRHSGAARRRAHLRFELVLALAVLVAFVPIKHWFEHTPFGRWLDVQAHVWLQSYLHPPDVKHLPVVVVDIADLKPAGYEVVTENNATRIEPFTPRDKLHTIVQVLATAGAAGIGVDVDMSLEGELKPARELQFQTQELFDGALAKQTNCAIYFGVKRNEGLDPEHWLGATKFIPLAASLSRPKGLVREMPSEFVFPGHSNHLKSLARALVDPEVSRRGDWLTNFAGDLFEDKPVTNAPDFRWSQYLVDYSPLKHLIANRIPVATVLAATNNDQAGYADFVAKVHGKLVLLGDATPFGGGDTANVPGHDEPVPGVYVHACGAYTLGRAPLYRLKVIPGLILATLGSLASVFLIYAMCFRFAGRHNVTAIPLTVLLTFVLQGLFILLAIVLARWGHVLWLEVIAVCVVLVVHCFAEILLGTIRWERFREGVVKPLVVTSAPGKEKE